MHEQLIRNKWFFQSRRAAVNPRWAFGCFHKGFLPAVAFVGWSRNTKYHKNTSTIIKRAPKAAKLLLRLAPSWLQVSNLRSSVSQSTSLCRYAMLITSADSSFPMVSWLGSLRNLAVLTWVVLCWHSDPSLPDLCWVPRMMKKCVMQIRIIRTCWALAWPYLYWNNILRQCCWIVAAFHHRKVHFGDGKLMFFFPCFVSLRQLSCFRPHLSILEKPSKPH